MHLSKVRLRSLPSRSVVLMLLTSLSVLTLQALASSSAANKDQGIYAENGVALAGYDVVAYFTENGPVQGSDQYTVEWQDLTWQFMNQEHADLFKAAPEKYEPKFGGFCAFGVTYGQRMKPDMNAWEIHDGRLYLYYDPPTRTEWSESRETNEKAASEEWQKMQPPEQTD